MPIVKHAIISAAGLGSRLGLNLPKCLVEVAGRKIIDYQLDLLKDVEDIRIVVGFMEDMVIEHVKKIRNDAIFVRNSDFRTTSNSYSLHLGSDNLTDPFISLDGDVLINAQSFKNFINICNGEKTIIGITKAKTEEAVFAHIDNGLIKKFSFEEKSTYEWSGIAYLKNISIEKNAGYVFREIEKYLPLPYAEIVCHEIDTPDDLELALKNISAYSITS